MFQNTNTILKIVKTNSAADFNHNGLRRKPVIIHKVILIGILFVHAYSSTFHKYEALYSIHVCVYRSIHKLSQLINITL